MAIDPNSTTKDYSTIIYNKTEIDAYNTAEQTRVNDELSNRVHTSSLGSPNGTATLDENGKVKYLELPIASVSESEDANNNTTVISPERLHYQISARTISSDKIGASNGIAPLGADSLVPSIYLPAIPAHQTIVVLTLQDMYDLPLTRTVTEGDRAIVTSEPTDVNGDKNGEYVANISTPSSTDWSKLPNLSLVDSVNGQTGNVVITSIAESATNTADIVSIKARMDSAEANITSNDGDIASLTTSVSTNTADIVVLESLTSGHTTSIGTNTADIATNTTAISGLNTRVTSLENGHAIKLVGSSTASSQQPLTTDSPLQVEYGIEQVTADVTLSSNGSVTFHTAGKYLFEIKMQYGRTGSVGVSHMVFRWKRNGVQEGQTLATKLDNADVLVPWASTDIIDVNQGDVFTSEIMRDSAGDDSGGLFAYSTTLAGWNNAPCATLILHKVL